MTRKIIPWQLLFKVQSLDQKLLSLPKMTPPGPGSLNIGQPFENTPMHKGHMGTCRNGVRTLQWRAWFLWGVGAETSKLTPNYYAGKDDLELLISCCWGHKCELPSQVFAVLGWNSRPPAG